VRGAGPKFIVMAGLVQATHEHRIAGWVSMGRRDKPDDDGKGKKRIDALA
jgi:hypothetical protein